MIVIRKEELEQFSDHRGDIINIFPDGVEIKSAMYITGKKGAQRGNHYHKKDVHYCYVTEGALLYESRNRKTGKIQIVHLFPGMIVANGPDEVHRFTFKTDGAFICLATQPRQQHNYEEDTIREDF